MTTRNNITTPARTVHPGEILREELRERGIRQKDFANQIGVQASHLSEFIRGKRNLNDDLAMKLERSLGIPFKVWMELHHGFLYDCKMIERSRTEERYCFNSKDEEPILIKENTSHPILGGDKIPYKKQSQVFELSILPKIGKTYSVFTL